MREKASTGGQGSLCRGHFFDRDVEYHVPFVIILSKTFFIQMYIVGCKLRLQGSLFLC